MSDGPFKCPHCGERFPRERLTREGQIPYHDFPKPCRAVCPGAKQAPRGEADNRPLWKDEIADDLKWLAEHDA